jgi:ABC-type amino acid transport substrate-binding protein
VIIPMRLAHLVRLGLAVVVVLACSLTASAGPDATVAAQGAPAFPAGSTMAQIVERGVLRVASTRDRPLVRYLDPITNELSGFEIDLIRELSNRLFGNPDQFEIVDTEFAARIPSVQQGIVDIGIVGMFVTPERMEQVDFSDIYYTGGLTTLVPADSPIQSKADLNGRKLIVTRATAAETEAQKQFPSSELLALDSIPLGVEALRAGRAEALIGGDDSLAGVAAGQPGFRMLPDLISCSPTAAIMKKGQADWVELVNQVIREYKQSGAWQQSWQGSYGRFITGAAPTPPPDTNDPKLGCRAG